MSAPMRVFGILTCVLVVLFANFSDVLRSIVGPVGGLLIAFLLIAMGAISYLQFWKASDSKKEQGRRAVPNFKTYIVLGGLLIVLGILASVACMDSALWGNSSLSDELRKGVSSIGVTAAIAGIIVCIQAFRLARR